MLRFVENNRVEFDVAQLIGIPPNQPIAGDDEIVFGYLGEQSSSVGADKLQDFEVRCKLVCFEFPIEDKAGGADNQAWPSRSEPLLLRGRHERQCLQRFAETHFVGENSAKAVASQKMEPGDALFLIGAQNIVQGAKWRA